MVDLPIRCSSVFPERVSVNASPLPVSAIPGIGAPGRLRRSPVRAACSVRSRVVAARGRREQYPHDVVGQASRSAIDFLAKRQTVVRGPFDELVRALAFVFERLRIEHRPVGLAENCHRSGHEQSHRRVHTTLPGQPDPGHANIEHRAGSRPEALEHLTAAAAMFDEMGMTSWRDRVEAERHLVNRSS
jgi:hypothetical protein